MIFNVDKLSPEQLIEYVAIKEPRREDDIVQICNLCDVEKAKIIASNSTWLTVGFSSYHLTLPIAKAFSKNKTVNTLIFQYGCSFDDGVFKELAHIPSLRKLLLPCCKITTKQILEMLECKKWEVIDLFYSNLEDEVLKPILNDKTWKVINLGGNNFCKENYKLLRELDDLYHSYIFDDSMSIEQKEQMIRTIYTYGNELHHRYNTPV